MNCNDEKVIEEIVKKLDTEQTTVFSSEPIGWNHGA